MKTCLMCGKEVSLDKGYVTDGLIYVCRDCAEKYSLIRIATRIGNIRCDTHLEYKWEQPIEQESVPDNSPEHYSTSDVELEADIEVLSPEDFLSKYADNPDAISRYMDMHPNECDDYV